MPSFPSREFAEALCRELSSSEGYRKAAKGWRWPILFKVAGGPGFVLDLYEGECREVIWLEDPSSGDAPYVLSASRESWLEVIEGRLHPLRAILKGSVRLEKGSYAQIARYAVAAMEIVKAARRALDP